MKAFEEWYYSGGCKGYTISTFGPARDSWKAALEWVDSQIFLETFVHDIIEEELKDDN